MQPKREIGTVEMVSVEWIMQNAKSSVDGFGCYDASGYWKNEVDYQAMINEKATHPHFGQVVSTIVERGFRVPILLHMSHGMLSHGNGHHRMCAAILLVLDEIPVFWEKDNGDWMRSDMTDSEELLDEETDGFFGLAQMIEEEVYS